jgi:hypothetical protein
MHHTFFFLFNCCNTELPLHKSRNLEIVAEMSA